MYQIGELLTEQNKLDIQKQLVETILSALETDAITTSAMRESARFILDNMGKLENKAQCIVFLESLKTKWPIFEPIFLQYKHTELEQKEQAVVNKLSSYIKTLN